MNDTDETVERHPMEQEGAAEPIAVVNPRDPDVIIETWRREEINDSIVTRQHPAAVAHLMTCIDNLRARFRAAMDSPAPTRAEEGA